MIIGEIIKSYRIKQKITQEEMAKVLHITPQAISRWETGISIPDISIIPQICNYLNISANELFQCKSSKIKIQNILQSQDILNQSQIDVLRAAHS